MTAARPRLTVVLLALGVAAAGTGCGVTSRNADRAMRDGGETLPVVDRSLPPRPLHAVDVDGSTAESLTPAVVASYPATAGATIEVGDAGDHAAFTELCAGEIDIVDSDRPISDGELAACQREGLQPVEIQVGAEAVVLVTRNGTDVGGDCLDLAQVRQIFRPGSTIHDWAQLGYYDLPLRVTGPDENQTDFDIFDEIALGSMDPTLADVRSDYAPQPGDPSVRRAVAGSDADQERLQRHIEAVAALVALQRALAQERPYVAQDRFQVAKGIHDHRSVAAQAVDAKTFAGALAQQRTLLADIRREQREIDRTEPVVTALHRLTGVLGFVGFDFYQDYEDELRPLEIDDGVHRPQLNCIFPSAQTITNASYPLSAPLLLTVALSDLRRPAVSAFLDYYLAHAGVIAGTSSDFVAVPAATQQVEEEWLRGTVTPPVMTTSAPTRLPAARLDPPAQGTLAPVGGAGGAGVVGAGRSAAGGSGAAPRTSQPLIPGQG